VSLHEHLRFVLALVSDWLKFAEAKNLAAVAFAGAAIGLYIRGVDIVSLPFAVKLLVSVGIAGLTLAGLCALVSFIPTIKIPLLYSQRAPQESDNLIYYGDLANYQPSEFLTRTEAMLGLQQHEALDEYYAQQIIVNARIALRKYKIFSLACWSGLTGLIFLGVGAIVRLLG